MKINDVDLGQAKDWKTADDPESYQHRIRSGFYPDEWFPVSYSSMERYDLCPQWYKFEYVDRLARESGHAAEIGSVLHEIQQELAELGFDGARAFISAMVPLTKKKEYKLLKAALDAISLKREFLYSTEERYNWEWQVKRERDDKELKVQFQAKIDLIFMDIIEPWIEIIDGKSGQDVLENIDHDPQGLAYSVVALSLPDFDMGFPNVIFSQAQWAKGRVVSTTFTLKEIEEQKGFLEEKVKRMVNDTEFKPNPGVQCQWCPFLYLCPAGQERLPELFKIAGQEDIPIKIQTWDEAVKIAGGAAYMRAVYLRLEKALAGYLKFAESVEGQKMELPFSGGKYAFKANDYRKPAGGIEGLLQRHPDEKENLTGSWVSRLSLERKDKK